MKKNRRKAWFEVIAGALLIVVGLIALSIPDGWWLTAICVVCGAIFVILALVTLSKSSAKNTHVVEGTFLSIGKYEKDWVGCYFEINGKQTRVAIFKDVYNPKILMPGGKYKLTLNNKDNSVVGVTRID